MPLNRVPESFVGDGLGLATQKELDQTNAQLADIMNINARSYKTDTNTWEDAIEEASIYANSIYTTGVLQVGDAKWVSNANVIVPRGNYTITREIVIPDGVDLELTNAVFVAEVTDKTINCFNITGNGYRNQYIGGVFAGFKKAFIISTNNYDTSRLYFSGQTFSRCQYGIDTVGYTDSRSTDMVIEKFTSYKTDVFAKIHTDMCSIKDGWITHSAWDGAAIYNQGYTKIENVIGVPMITSDTSFRPRWIDNHSEDGSTTETLGERGIYINHCRFGSEAEGGMPIIFNYAKADTDLSNYKATIISIENSLVSSTGTNDDSLIILFDVPNRITLKNIAGLTNLGSGLIHADSTFDTTLITNSRYISIDIDDSGYASKSFPLVDNDLFRFLKTNENLNTQFRNIFTSGQTHLQYDVIDAGLEATTDRPLSEFVVDVFTPVTDNQEYADLYGFSFLLVISGIESGNSSYTNKSNGLYYVTATGGYANSQKNKRLNVVQIAGFNGGDQFGEAPEIKSVLWETSGTSDILFSTQENIKVTAYGWHEYTHATVIPLFGSTAHIS